MITEDEAMRLLKRADPARVDDATAYTDAAGYLAALRTRSTTVTVIDTEPTPTRRPSPHRWLIAAAAAVVVAVVVGGLVLATRDDDPNEQIPAATTLAPDAETSAEEVARGFLDARVAYDADRAITYLADDAVAEIVESPAALQLELDFLKAQAYTELILDCEQQDETAVGVIVRCPFDFHAIRSDEIGLGPYTDNYWELNVRDGKITATRVEVPFMTNGFSREMWVPFANWVATTHPDDVLTMYTDSGKTMQRITEESIRLWGLRTRDYVDEVRSERGQERLQAVKAGIGLIGLPPGDATPSTPERGQLVDDFALRQADYHFAGAARLYADGRLIWRLYLPVEEWSSSTGWVEQRLTPEAVQLIRDHVIVDISPGGEHRDMEVSQFFGLLPPSAWEDQRPYVPSGYGVCLQLIGATASEVPVTTATPTSSPATAGGNGPALGAPTEQLLAVLPAPAADLLDGRPTAPNDAFSEIGCLALPTDDARLLDRALSDGGAEQVEQRNQFFLQYQLDHPIEDSALLEIFFEPMFPDGSISCSACG